MLVVYITGCVLLCLPFSLYFCLFVFLGIRGQAFHHLHHKLHPRAMGGMFEFVCLCTYTCVCVCNIVLPTVYVCELTGPE